jgi:high-affinity Fe2+/Pb2+ permease
MIIALVVGASCAGTLAWLLVMAARSFPNNPFDLTTTTTVIAAAALGGVLFSRAASRKFRL